MCVFRGSQDKRLKEENEAYKTWYVGRQATCKEVKEEIQKWSEWQRYLECQQLPDPDSQKSLNTFLSQWDESVSRKHWQRKRPSFHLFGGGADLSSLGVAGR